VAHCPFLWLEEYGQTPFPFPSVSHHCYVSSPARPAGQQEQQRYCLTKRHTSCPLFPSPPVEETVVVAAEPVVEVTGVRPVVSPLPQEPVEKRRTSPLPVLKPSQVLPPELGHEPVGDQVAREAANQPGPEPVPAGPRTAAQVAPEETVVPPGPAAMTLPTTILPWAVGAAVTLLLFCLGALVVSLVSRLGAGIDLAALELPPLWPGALILLSVVSFAGAALLLGLLLWARHRAST
jgi:hypothetical protein